jgi:acetolactate synthase-1/2/3 large subunit
MIEALARAQALGLPHPRPVTCPHENTAQHMAIGYYLATGRPQLTMHHVNVGTANAMNGLLNASRGQVPILFTAGRTPINEDTLTGHRTLDIHWTQEMYDQAAMVRESVKWDYELRNAEQLETIVDRMLTVAMSDPKGPVYLSLPREVLARRIEKFTYSSPSRMRPAAPSAPSPAALDEAASILARAQHPVIITNWGGRNPGVMPALTALADRYAIPVVEYRNRYIAMPTHHPMMAGGNPDPFVKAADAILVLDTAVPWQPSRVRPSAECKVIHMAPDPLYTYVPVRGFPADLSLACASDLGLTMLHDAMAEHAKSNAARIAKRRDECAAHHAKLEENWAKKLAAGENASPIAPAWISHCINKVRTKDAIIVKESGLQTQYLDVDRPCMVLNPGAASGLGHGMGVALGLKLANRDTLVIGTEGDGAYMYNVPVSAHYVAAEQQLPVLWVIFNNQRWQAVRNATRGLNPEGYAASTERAPLTYFTVEQHYDKLVEVSGGYGERVTEARQVLPALERAMKAVLVEKRQALLNVVCDVDASGSGD